MRTYIALLSAILIIFATPRAVPAQAAGPMHIDAGDTEFWNGSYIDTQVEGSQQQIDALTTGEGGYRLRVALDLLLDYRADGKEHESADQGRDFQVALLRDGEEVLSGSNADGPWGYSVELLVCFTATDAACGGRPHGVPCTTLADDSTCDSIGESGGFGCDADTCQRPYTALAPGSSEGAWTITVTAEEVDGWSYRMRAALERPPSGQSVRADRLLSPNLRAIPPFELTLDCASVQGSGAGARTGVCGAEAGAAGEAFTGCTPLELSHNPHVKRCLRFSGGEEIAGAQPGSVGGGGPLDIEGRDPVTDPVTGNITARAVQVRRAPDGTIDEHDAGTLYFHNSHGHWHYEGFMQYELFHVTGDTSTKGSPSKRLISSADLFGAKRGWNPADERMADWFRFNQGVNNAGSPPPASPNCGVCQPRLYQTVGWGDFYEWPVEEQFVPIATVDYGFALGHYLLREVVDRDNRLIESDETDNTSYAYFEVTGPRDLRIIERGYGLDPWDPHKVVETVGT